MMALHCAFVNKDVPERRLHCGDKVYFLCVTEYVDAVDMVMTPVLVLVT